jgi:dihydroorotase
LQHLSTRGALRAVAQAKRRGLPVSCEATYHHLLLTDLDVADSLGPGGPNPDFKMNPPLGRPADRDALREALADGTIDCLATDHAPHSAAAKARGFELAPFGVIGLETALGLALVLVRQGLIDRRRAVGLMTSGPAGVLGIPAGSLAVGRPADVCLVDPDRSWRVVPARMLSRSRNTPFGGWTLPGQVVGTLVDGTWVHRRGLRQEVLA